MFPCRSPIPASSLSSRIIWILLDLLKQRQMDLRMFYQFKTTKFLYLVPIAEPTSATIFFKIIRFIATFEILKLIITDQDRKFCPEFMTYAYENLGIHKIQWSPYRPKSNGALERSHCTIKEHLKFYINLIKITGILLYPQLSTCLIHKCIVVSTGYSPSELINSKLDLELHNNTMLIGHHIRSIYYSLY